MNTSANLYEKDFYAWTQEQAQLIKENALTKLDLIHLQEELISMGATEKRELARRLEQLLMHLLKWEYQPNYINKKSWARSIKEQHKKTNKTFKRQSKLNESRHV